MRVRSALRRLLAPLLAVSSETAFACSGPGASQAIADSERLGKLLWWATLLIAVTFLAIPRARRRQAFLLGLVVLHPGSWMSARSGDCGRMLSTTSIIVTALALLAGALICWTAPSRT